MQSKCELGKHSSAAGKKILLLLLFLFLDKPKNSAKTVGVAWGQRAWPPRQGEPQLRVQLLRMGTDRPGRWLCVTGLNRAIDGPKSVWSFVHQRPFAVVVSVGSERGRPRRPRSWHGEVSRLRTGSGAYVPQFVREGSDGSFVPATRALQPSRRTTRGKL